MTSAYTWDARGQETDDVELFRRAQRTSQDNEAARAREVLVDRYSWLVRWAAKRYASRGEHVEELTQVGYLGLVEAINRFDTDRGVEFVAFARPTVLGEIRRHFRDGRRWVRLPRKIQELKSRIRDATDELVQTTGNMPTPAKLAAYLEVSQEDVTEALAADDAFAPLSLDAPIGGQDADVSDAASHLDGMADDDARTDEVVDSQALWLLLHQLPPREQQILLLRYFGNKSQAEIGQRLGISQMHVSRLLRQTLGWLHTRLNS